MPFELECKVAVPDMLYEFKYDDEDNFFIWSNKEWHEMPSTAFTFLNVAN